MKCNCIEIKGIINDKVLEILIKFGIKGGYLIDIVIFLELILQFKKGMIQ